MTYTPFLIADFSTGIDRALQPWLSPDDSQQELFDGYVYKGVMNKRDGYVGYATGQKNGSPYCESRMVNRISDEVARTSGGVIVQGNGTVGPYSFRIQNLPLRRGTVEFVAGAQSAIDDGLGNLTTSPLGGSGTIDYRTGDVVVSFLNVVPGATPITINYDYHPGNPVMGVMNFISETNVKQLLVADTKRVNIYDSTTNRLEYVGATYAISGITQANPGVVTTTAPHNLITGDRVFIYGVNGMNEVNNNEYTIIVTGGSSFSIDRDTSADTAYTNGGTVQLIYSGTNFNFWSSVNYPDSDGNPRLIFTNNKDEVQYYAPHLNPPIGDYVNYPTAATPQFNMTADDGTPITTFTALQTFINQDRLLFTRTTENGVVKPRRIRISGTGASSDDFRSSALGAGFIDLSDQTWIKGSAFNRDDLIHFTESSTHTMSYSGNDTAPFVTSKIDESRGSGASFSAITYLNRTTAASPRGLIITDGYRVERADGLLPQFTFDEIDNQNFELCFAGSVDADRDHYLLYPTPNSSRSNRILTTNYEEDNYAIYRLPLSCMGNYQISFDITWNDLLIYDNWSSFANDYGDWNSFAYSAGAPISIGGGHNGQVWRLNAVETEDNPQKIRNVTIIDGTTLEITTDYNTYSLNEDDPSLGADYICLTGMNGMVQANDKQYPIIQVVDEYTFRVQVPTTANFSPYVSGGTASRVIPFMALFKKFNPYVSVAKKVRCGWIYFYVSCSKSDNTTNFDIVDITQSDPAVVTTSVANTFKTGDTVNLFGISGMVELNDQEYYITRIDEFSFSLNVDSTGYTAYTSGGYASIQDAAKIEIDIITNDVDDPIVVQNYDNNPLQCNTTNLVFEDGFKKWYKSYINQIGRFIQFRLRNQQAGAKIAIHATMPGFMPVGRLI